MKILNIFLEPMKNGSPVMWVIVALSILSLFLFLLKVFQFHRDEINVRELLRGLYNALKRNRTYVEALTLCDTTPGPVARLVAAAIVADERGDEDLRSAIDNAALDEIPKLERFVNVIGIIGFIMPLLGFLGTVHGMMDLLQVGDDTMLRFKSISASVGTALTSTATALVVAIPLYVAYNYLVARINSILLDMEKASYEIIALLSRSKSNRQKSPEEH